MVFIPVYYFFLSPESEMAQKTFRPKKQLGESPNLYSCFWSTLMSLSSPFYEAYLQRHGNELTTSLCAYYSFEHTTTKFCLSYTFSPRELSFLLDFLERSPRSTLSSSLFISLLRHCDYLMLSTLHKTIYDNNF